MADSIDMSDKETADHIRKWIIAGNHGPWSWPTDGCGYNQHVKFVKYRNKFWKGPCEQWETFEKFLLDYADRLEKGEIVTPRPEITEEPLRCKMCGSEFHGGPLKDPETLAKEIRDGVCNVCYAMEVSAGDTW